MNIFYISQNDIDNHSSLSKDDIYKKRIEKFKEKQKIFKGKNLKFLEFFDRGLLNKQDSLNRINVILENLTKNGINKYEIVLAVDNNYLKKSFDQNELNNLKNLSNYFEKQKIELGVFDYNYVFKYDDVKNANDIITEKANLIKKLKLSPLEKLLYSYMIVTSKNYQIENEDEALAQSRSIYGVLNGDKICCVGYSEFLKSIITELNDENLKIFANSVGILRNINNKKEYGIHRTNIVYIEDDKYNLNGFYYLDPTWDYGQKTYLTYFLVEISQIQNTYGYQICDSSEAFKNVLKKQDDIYKQNAIENYSNVIPNFASSVSSKSAKLNLSELKKIEKYDEDTLAGYLNKSEKFNEFLTYKKTEEDILKNTNLKSKQDEVLINNYLNLKNESIKNRILKNEKIVWEYLNQNSPHVDIYAIQNALQTLFTKLNTEKSKDEISNEVYKILKSNIKFAKQLYNSESSTIFSECEPIK